LLLCCSEWSWELLLEDSFSEWSLFPLSEVVDVFLHEFPTTVSPFEHLSFLQYPWTSCFPTGQTHESPFNSNECGQFLRTHCPLDFFIT